MARPRYRLIDYFYDQNANVQDMTSSGTSAKGALRTPGQEIEWEDRPGWMMEPINDEARAMVEKYPPEEPMLLDQMIERGVDAARDAVDHNLKNAPAVSNVRANEPKKLTLPRKEIHI